LSSSRQFLQIIDENASQNASDFIYLEIKSKNYKEKDRAYVIEEDEHDNEIENYSHKNKYYHEFDFDLNYYNSQDQKNKLNANFFILAQIFTCRKCKQTFSSNNRLHKHLWQTFCENFRFTNRVNSTHDKILNEVIVNLVVDILLVESSIDSFKDIDTDFEFRDWIYVKTMINLFINDNEIQICLDTDCSVTLTDRNFIKIHESHYIIRRMTISLNVRELRINKHEISKYIIVNIYFAEKIIEEKFIRKVIRRKVHLIDDLKVNMLIENDILESENIFIDDINSKVIIISRLTVE
jgi:hypothetical protein